MKTLTHPLELKAHQRFLRAARSHKQADAELVEALIEVIQERSWEKLGYPSLFRYAVEVVDLSESVAYSAIAVASQAEKLPLLRASLQKGLHLSKAKKIVSVIKPENEAEWVRRAESLSSRALEKEVARENPKTLTPERARYVTAERLELKLGIDEALLEKLKRAQDLVSRSQGRSVTLEETLQAVLSHFIEKKDPVEKAKRSKSVPKLVTGPIPQAARHAVNLRDQGKCQSPGCTQTRFTEIHHIIPQSQGGTHALENLITLCSAHHRQEHDPGPS